MEFILPLRWLVVGHILILHVLHALFVVHSFYDRREQDREPVDKVSER